MHTSIPSHAHVCFAQGTCGSVPGCWSVRPQPDGTTTIDWAHPAPGPPPVTTIAWRLCHVAGTVLAWRSSNHVGDGTWTPVRDAWPATADAVAYPEHELIHHGAEIGLLRDLYRARALG